MDSSGNILHSHCYGLLPFTVLQSVRKQADNEFRFVGGYLHDSCAAGGAQEVDPVIGKMDSLGNVLSMHHYQLNSVVCSNTAADLAITSDAGAVVWGRDDSFFALRVDQSGVPLWSKQFPHHGWFNFIKELPGGDMLLGFSMDSAGASLARLDPNGNFMWCKSYMRPMGRMHDAIMESDSSFIITGFTGSTPQKLFMMKLNGAGDVQWCRGYANGMDAWASLYPSRIARTVDGKQVVLATLGKPVMPYFYRPFLMKTDQNGDTLWTRSVGAPGYVYYAINLLASSDGGFYYDGGADGDFGQWSSAAFLFKTDSLGHLPCHEHVHPIEVLDLFPVDSSFTLNAVEGAVAIETSNTEVTYDPIVVFDGCTFTTGLPPKPRSYRSMSVHPNPNAGHFTLTFKDPLQAESYYSVYDAAGKLLYQRPLPTGKGTEEVDLSRYGKGTYVIKCTDKEGVYHERVVVE